MKNFFKTVGESFYSSSLYQKAKSEGVSGGVKFILKASLFLGILLGVIGLIVFLISYPNLKKMALGFFDKSYPTDLVVTIVDGNLTANNTLPVFIPLPISDDIENDGAKIPTNLTVLVPNEKAEVSVLAKYDTFSAITSNGFIAMKSNNGFEQVTTYPFSKINKVFTKSSALEDILSIFKVWKMVIIISIIPLLIMFSLVMSFGNMILMFLIALLIYLLFKIKKLNITYKESYKIGLYTLVPLLLLQVLATPLNISGFLFKTVVVLAIILFATHTWKNEEKGTEEAVVKQM